MRGQDEQLRTFMQCLMLPSPPPASKSVSSKMLRTVPRGHVRIDLPFDQALEQLTACIVHEQVQERSNSGWSERQLRRPASSSQGRLRGAAQLKRSRSTGGSPSSKRGFVPEGTCFNNPFGQWPRTPPHLVGVMGGSSLTSSPSRPKREAWGSEAEEPGDAGKEGGKAANNQDMDEGEMDLLRPKTHPRPPKKGPSSSSKLQVNQARSSSRARKKTLAPSPSRRASDNSSVSGLSTLGTLKLGSEGSSAFGSREPSKVKGTLLSQTWPMGQQYLSPEVPVVEEEQNRAKDFTEQALAVKLCLPLEVAKQAAECFKHHAQCDASDRPDLWRLKRSDFEKVLCEIFCISSVQELPDHFVSKVFHCADVTRSGDLDLEEFMSWYTTFSFSEELLLGKSTKSIRDVARRMGINLLDIDRYKKVFDSYDKNKSGVLEIDEFGPMLQRVLKIPAGHQLPSSQIKSYWNMADRDNNGVIDFPEFCQFYLKIFRKNGEENFQLGDIYRGIRNVSVRRRVSGAD